jgi:hypothetical protein
MLVFTGRGQARAVPKGAEPVSNRLELGRSSTMIETAVVDEVRRRLQEGRASQRRIAVELGISRGTVNTIARGARADYPTGRPSRVNGFVPPSGLHSRCPGCGGKVQMPCLLCYIRDRAAKTDRQSDSTRAGG